MSGPRRPRQLYGEGVHALSSDGRRPGGFSIFAVVDAARWGLLPVRLLSTGSVIRSGPCAANRTGMGILRYPLWRGGTAPATSPSAGLISRARTSKGASSSETSSPGLKPPLSACGIGAFHREYLRDAERCFAGALNPSDESSFRTTAFCSNVGLVEEHKPVFSLKCE